jgi:hypothetical protein
MKSHSRRVGTARARRARAAVVVVAALGAIVSAAAALPAFTTAPKSGSGGASGIALLEHVRVGRHAGFDRVVFEFAGGTSAYSVRYVPKVLHDGSGLPVRLAGRSFLEVVFRRAKIDRASTGGPDIVRTPRFPTLVQLKESGDFEAVVSFGLGLRSKVGFRVFSLAAPGRVVIDVAH